MAKTLIGNIKGPKGDTGAKGNTGAQGPEGPQGPKGATGATGAQGPEGPQGAKGATGTRGSRWSEGTAITGTSTTATIFSGTGITDALVNDHYLNTSTGNVYKCTTAGTASVAKWIYVGNIKGAKGATGNTGATGPEGPQGEQGPKGDKGDTGDTPTLISTYEDLMANTVSGYAPDALVAKEAIAMLRGEIKAVQIPIMNVSTSESAINEYLDALNNVPNNTHYIGTVNCSVAHSVIGGGTFFVEGYNHDGKYAWQKLTRYSAVGSKLLKYERTKYNGTWGEWMSV